MSPPLTAQHLPYPVLSLINLAASNSKSVTEFLGSADSSCVTWDLLIKHLHCPLSGWKTPGVRESRTTIQSTHPKPNNTNQQRPSSKRRAWVLRWCWGFCSFNLLFENFMDVCTPRLNHLLLFPCLSFLSPPWRAGERFCSGWAGLPSQGGGQSSRAKLENPGKCGTC